MSLMQVAIDRSRLPGSPAPLLIRGDSSLNYQLPRDGGLGEITKAWRRSYATSPYVHGALQTSAVLEQSSLPMRVQVWGDTAAQLDQRLEDLEEALFQFYFTTTITLNGVAKSWACDCADVTPEAPRAPFLKRMLQRVVVTIPVYPIPGTA